MYLFKPGTQDLRESFGNLIDDVNQLVAEKEIIIDGRKVPLDIYLGGDSKFLFGYAGYESCHLQQFLHLLQRFSNTQVMKTYCYSLCPCIGAIHIHQQATSFIGRGLNRDSRGDEIQ